VKPIDVAVTRLAARQYSLAHRHQLLDLGMTARQINSRLSAGWLTRVHQAVYLVGSGASSPEQAVMAAYLAAGSEALASHRSAGALWGMRGVETPAMPEITLWADRHRPLQGVTVHRTSVLDPVDISRVRRIPVTTPARTLLDLGAVAPALVVESALEDALMRRLVTFQLLTATLERLGGPGRNGAGVLRALVEERDPATAPTESVLEDLLFGVLRRGGLPEPVRQYEVAGVRLDGAYPHIRLGLEADSRVWHGGRLDVQRNADKANVLLAHGWRVLRFTWFHLTRRASYVVDTVARQLALSCPA
jgi:very-short-patch-repair endonuclease